MVRRCMSCMKEYTVPQGYEQVRLCCPHCGYLEGTPPKEANHLYPGMVLQDRYEIGIVVGFGGFGIIYKAWDRQLDIVVAIKEYYPSGMVTREPGQKNVIVYEGDRKKDYYEGLGRFLEEARTTAQFDHSEYIVQVKNFFQENNTAYIVMEYLNGISLKEYMKMSGKMKVKDALQVTDAVVEALKEMHAAGILHRDIGPGNIFIYGRQIKVIDFGLARLSDTEKELTRSVALTPGYAPPEQYQNKSKQGPWTDIYALAATLYTMVTGQKPEESSDRQMEDLQQDAKDVNPEIPEDLSNAIMKGMAVNPELRFRTVEDFSEAIHGKKKVDTPKEELGKRKRRRLISIAAVILVLLTGVAFIGLHYRRQWKDTHLSEAALKIWVPYEDDHTAEEAKNRFEGTQDMAGVTKSFHDNFPQIVLEVEYIPRSQYGERLKSAAASGSLPAVYCMDGVDPSLLDQAEDLGTVYDALAAENYYYLDDYRKQGDPRQIPMGLDVPIIYAGDGTGYDYTQLSLTDYPSLQQEPATGYYMVPEDYSMLINTMGGSFRYTDKLEMDQKAKDMITDLLTYETASSGEGGEAKSIADTDAAGQAFAEGKITYFLGSYKDQERFDRIASERAYRHYAVPGQTIYAEFCDYWCISKSAAEDEDVKKAAEKLLEMMMEPYGQQAMHNSGSYREALPINKDAFKTFVESETSLDFLNGYMDHLTFLYRDREAENGKARQLQSDVVVDRKKTVEQWLEE